MQTSQLPASLCSKLEKITRDFIWNSTVDQHRTSLVSWKEMCRPQQFCGCGLKKLSSQNQALLMKIGFALISRPDQLWVQVLRAKYKFRPEGRVPPNVINCSHLWRSLTKLFQDIKLGVKWEVGDGSSIKFWQDHWVGDLGPLKNLSLSEIPSVELARPIKNYVDNNGEWNWRLFEHLLPTNIVLQIAGIKPPCNDDGNAVCYWYHNPIGNFTTSSGI